MAEKYQLSYTAQDIDNRLEKAGNAVLFLSQSITDDQKETARQNIGAAKEKSKFYTSLSLAIADITAGHTDNARESDTGASVKVFTAENGRTAVMLLSDITESTTITVSDSIDLILAGRTLCFDTADAMLEFTGGGECTIDGSAPGSKILKEINSITGSIKLMKVACGSMQITGGSYHLLTNGATGGYVLSVTNACVHFDMADCSILREFNSNGSGIQMVAREAVVKNSTIQLIASGNGGTAILNNAYTEPKLEVENCTITSTSSGSGSATCVDYVGVLRLVDCELMANGKEYAVGINAQDSFASAREIDACTVKVYSESVTAIGVAICGVAKINNCTVTAESVNGGVHGIYGIYQADMKVDGGSITVKSDNNYAFGIYNKYMAKINGTNVNATTTTDGSGKSSYGVYNTGTAKLENVWIMADAPGSHVDGEEISIGIFNDDTGTVYANNCESYGSHSGIQSTGNLYIRGGTYGSWSHGGVYMVHGPNKTAYFKDCIFITAYYIGQFGEYLAEYGSNCYLGDKSSVEDGGTAYMDGCIFTVGEGVSYVDGFCIRNTTSGSPNRLYISNSKFNGDFKYRVQNDGSNQPAELYIGTGCNFTIENASTGEYAPPSDADASIFETGGLYRKHYAGEELTAEDFAALVAFMNQ